MVVSFPVFWPLLAVKITLVAVKCRQILSNGVKWCKYLK
jgi:hypothetical protein